MATEKKKILIVEDDSFLLGMYANKLEMDDYRVFVAEDGKKGLRLALNEKPDIILLDIRLPEIDGFEILKRVKENEETKNIPIILLTNLSQKEDVEKGLAMGADDYLIKAHFMPSEVIDKINALLRK